MTLLFNRAIALHALGRVDAAVEGYRLSLAAAELAGDFSGVRLALARWAGAELDAGRIDASQDLLRRAEGVGEEVLPTDAQEMQMLRLVRGRLAMVNRQWAQARKELSAVIESRRPANITVIALTRRAELGWHEGSLEAALRDAQDAIDMGTSLQGGKPYSWRTGDAWRWRGRILSKRGDKSDARAAYETARSHFSHTVDPSHPALGQLRQLLDDSDAQ